MIAQITGLNPGEFIHTLGDAHIYLNHIEKVKLQLTREPFPLAKMILNPAVKDISEFRFEDFTLTDYKAHPHIKGDISI
jgi:thymidylate synthase